MMLNSSCRSINLSGNGAVTNEGWPPSRLLEVLRGPCSTLTALDVSSNGLRDDGCAALVDAIAEGSRAQSTPIVQLGLGGNRASFRTSRAVAEWLERPGCALEHLRMAWNELAASAAELLGALSTNASLRSLDLSWCGVEESGAVAIGVALRSNTALQTLTLAHNRIGPYGAVAAADGLSRNASLKSVDFSFNPLGQVGVGALHEGVRRADLEVLLQASAPTFSDEQRCKLDESCPGGFYDVRLERPYDRWLLKRCVEITGKPSDGSARLHSRRLLNLVVDGEQMANVQPSASTIEGWRSRGTASFDVNGGTPPLMLFPVELDLSIVKERQVMLLLMTSR